MEANNSFHAILGHDAAKEVLLRAIEHPGHGYLILGPDGTGCHALAEVFVRALADHPADRSLHAHPDIITLTREPTESGKSLKKEIAVRAVRELRVRVSQRPSVAKRVVAYIPEADFLNEEGVNALLKSVEEPPAGAVFVLVAHQESRLPATLLSRLAHLRLGRVPSAAIGAWLAERGIADRVGSDAVAFAEGRPGYALRYAEDESFRAEVGNAEETVDQLINARNEGDAFAAIAEQAYVCDSAEDPVTEWRKTLQLWEAALRRRFRDAPERACGLAHAFLVAERNIGGPVSPRILIELGLVRAANDRPPVFPDFLPSPFPYPLD